MPSLSVTDHGPVRLLTLDRPEVKNALSRELRDGLLEQVVGAGADDAVRVLVLTGAGDAFCAGLDLAELEGTVAASPEEHRADTTALAELFLAIIDCPKPIVAAVNGPAVAGGAGIVTACDVAFAADGARFGYTEARIGFVAALVSVLLVRQVGEKHARELLLGARLIDASRAQAMGLVNHVVPADELLERTMDFARRMADNAPSSLAATKKLLTRVATADLADGMAAAVEANVASRQSSELAEGVRAFFEKRDPRWRAS